MYVSTVWGRGVDVFGNQEEIAVIAVIARDRRDRVSSLALTANCSAISDGPR
jgi:hypothetical protein